MSRLKNGLIPQPQLKTSDELFVAGFVKTRPFEFWLGDGQNAAGNLIYSLSATEKRFTLGILSSVPGVTGRLKVNTDDMGGLPVEVRVNGALADSFTGGGIYTYAGLANGQTLVFQPQTLGPMYLSATVANGQIILEWNAVAGLKYRLQFKQNLNDLIWSNVVPDVVASGSSASQTNALSSSAQRFYRVIVVP